MAGKEMLKMLDCISALVSLERDEDVINFNAALTLILRKVTCGSDTILYPQKSLHHHTSWSLEAFASPSAQWLKLSKIIYLLLLT